MKKLLISLLLATTTLAFAGCSKGGNEEAGSDATGAADMEVSLSVQVEEAWLPYYEKTKETVLKTYPKAQIDFITTGSFRCY